MERDGTGLMSIVVFWTVWLLITAYLFGQWQRYEPTRMPVDFAAAVVSFPLALVIAAAV